jgi:hypothetical protein
MAKPSSRQGLIDYCLRKLGAPVLEINVAQEQLEDLVDDAVQLFQERHFDGVSQTLLKYKITQEDIDQARGKANVGITTVTGTYKNFQFEENGNYLQIPDYVIGINRVFKFNGTNNISNNMFNIKYQLFLNDIYYWGSMELLTYTMTMRYLEDIDWLLNTEKQIRFNKREDKLYMDVDWAYADVDSYIIIDCLRALDPAESTKVWNDSFLKRYLTATIKRQWGQNLLKFRGMKMPGGIELNGRELYDDAQREIDQIMERMSMDYEVSALDLIG